MISFNILNDKAEKGLSEIKRLSNKAKELGYFDVVESIFSKLELNIIAIQKGYESIRTANLSEEEIIKFLDNDRIKTTGDQQLDFILKTLENFSNILDRKELELKFIEFKVLLNFGYSKKAKIASKAKSMGYTSVYNDKLSALGNMLDEIKKTTDLDEKADIQEASAEMLNSYKMKMQGAKRIDSVLDQLAGLSKEIDTLADLPSSSRNNVGWTPDDMEELKKRPSYRPSWYYHSTDSVT